jgi:hypothetical protein
MSTDTRPSQHQIGAWLGVSQPVVSGYARAGMPTDSLEAAADWYDRNVHPRARNIDNGRTPVRFAATDGRYRSMPAPPPGVDPDISPEQFLGGIAMANGAAMVEHVLRLSQIALSMLRAGRFAEIEEPLRFALRAVPKQCRGDIQIDFDNESPGAMPVAVWEELLRPLFDRMGMNARTEAEVERDRAQVAAQTPEQTERTTRFLYAAACGEWVPAPKPPAPAPAPAPAKKARRR